MVKIHGGSRSELFTPGGGEEERCPVKLGDLASLRRTVGKTKKGREFGIEDNWKRPDRAHRELAEEWTGRTEFFLKSSVRAR